MNARVMFERAAHSASSPPPCGEGLGVGVVRGAPPRQQLRPPSLALPQRKGVYARLRRAMGGGNTPAFVANKVPA
jgi:hypothetical protein